MFIFECFCSVDYQSFGCEIRNSQISLANLGNNIVNFIQIDKSKLIELIQVPSDKKLV